MNTPVAERALLLGVQHRAFGRYAVTVLGEGRTALAISAGSDSNAPSLAWKGDAASPNEDAVFALDQGDAVLLAVADGHFGLQASHGLLSALAQEVTAVPDTEAALVALLEGLQDPRADRESRAGTTLLVVAHRRDRGEGFGVAFGDSTCCAVGPQADGRAWAPRNRAFVGPAQPHALADAKRFAFRYRLPPDHLLLAFTDGVDECHYQSPRTSVQPSHLTELHARTGSDPESYARALATLALEGVGGHPGGQDNLALAVTRS